MARVLLLALLLLAWPKAQAQEKIAVSCWPYVWCDGDIVRSAIRRGTLGWHGWVFYTMPNGRKVYVNHLLCAHDAGQCSEAIAKATQAAMECSISTDPWDCATAKFGSEVLFKCPKAGDPPLADAKRRALCDEGLAFRTADAAENGIAWPGTAWPPATVAHVVSRLGMRLTSTDRPAYPLANGVRGTTSTARAALNGPDGNPAPCDCSVGVTEGSSLYCAHDAARQTVTLCRVK